MGGVEGERNIEHSLYGELTRFVDKRDFTIFTIDYIYKLFMPNDSQISIVGNIFGEDFVALYATHNPFLCNGMQCLHQE
jgi:hypothetical protein